VQDWIENKMREISEVYKKKAAERGPAEP